MPSVTNFAFRNALLALAVLGVLATASVTLADDEAAPPSSNNILSAPPPGIGADTIAQPAVMPADPHQAAMVRRGEYLATAGDCQYCHSVPGGVPYAGGQPLQMPTGALFSPNITPDRQAGIGGWSDRQFYRALHDGIAPGHSLLVFPRYLYPVMPWQDYNKLSYTDVMAIKAYLDTLPAASQPNRPSELVFPFTIRAGLLAWRLLFFNDNPIQYDPAWSPQIRNGAFLVQALAHCGECHTQRNLLMATEPSRYLAGGHILEQSWYAPNITSDANTGVGGWNAGNLVAFLHGDGALGVAGSPYGPMKQVVEDSLSRLPVSDAQDIAAYLQTAVPAKPAAFAGAQTGGMVAGAQVYAGYCARCHGGNGEGVDNNFPNLAGNQSVWNGAPENVISMVLGGYQPWHENQSGMPEFNQTLSDQQIADVTNYLRTAWGNKGTAIASASQVADARGLASGWATLSTGNTQASLDTNGAWAHFNDISGKVEVFGDKANCMLNASFRSADPAAPAKSVIIAGACAKSGGAFHGTMTIDGTAYPADLVFQEIFTGGHLSGLRLSGTPKHSSQFLDARINLIEPAA